MDARGAYDLASKAYAVVGGTPFVGKKVSITQANASENNIGYRQTFDVSAFDMVGATVEIQFDFYTKSTNINQVWGKLYTGNVSGSVGDGEGFDNLSNKWTVSPDTLHTYTSTFTTTLSKTYVHVFVWPSVITLSQATDYFFKDVKVKINGISINTTTPVAQRIHNATGTVNNVTTYDDIFAPKSYVDTSVAAVTPVKKYQNKIWNVLGDSITQGTGTTIKYHDYLKTELGFTTVNNYGIGGSTIAKYDAGDTKNSMALRYTTMTNSVDLVTVFGGTNDAAGTPIPLGAMSDRTVDTFYGAYHVLLSGLIEKYVGKKIAVFTMIIRYSVANSLMSTYAQAIREVAAYYSIPCLDLFSSANIYSYSDNVKTAIVPDGIHPNEAGHRILADRIGAFLSSI